MGLERETSNLCLEKRHEYHVINKFCENKDKLTDELWSSSSMSNWLDKRLLLKLRVLSLNSSKRNRQEWWTQLCFLAKLCIYIYHCVKMENFGLGNQFDCSYYYYYLYIVISDIVVSYWLISGRFVLTYFSKKHKNLIIQNQGCRFYVKDLKILGFWFLKTCRSCVIRTLRFCIGSRSYL